MADRALTVADRAPQVGDVLIDPQYPNLWQKWRVVSFVNDGATGIGYRHHGRNKEHFVVVPAMWSFRYKARLDCGPVTVTESEGES